MRSLAWAALLAVGQVASLGLATLVAARTMGPVTEILRAVLP